MNKRTLFPLLILALMLVLSAPVMAQDAPPPDDGYCHIGGCGGHEPVVVILDGIPTCIAYCGDGFSLLPPIEFLYPRRGYSQIDPAECTDKACYWVAE